MQTGDIRQFMVLEQGRGDAPPQYTICLAWGSSGAVSVSAIAGCCDGYYGCCGGCCCFCSMEGLRWRGSCGRVALESQLEGCWIM